MANLNAAYLAERAREAGMPLLGPGQIFPGGDAFAGVFQAAVPIPSAQTGTNVAPQALVNLHTATPWARDPRARQAGIVAAGNINTLIGFYGVRCMAAAVPPSSGDQLSVEQWNDVTSHLYIRVTSGQNVRFFPLPRAAWEVMKVQTQRTQAVAADGSFGGTAPSPGHQWNEGAIWANFNTDQVDVVTTFTGAMLNLSNTVFEFYGVMAKSNQVNIDDPCGQVGQTELKKMPRAIQVLR